MRYAAIFTFAFVLTSVTQAQIAWEQNLKDAHAKAKQEGKLMLLHFYSDNCVWCDRLEAGAFKSQPVADALSKDFVPVKIHGTQNPKLTSMFKVSKYPTDVIVTTDGKALTHQVSPQQSQRYIAMLSGAQTRFTKQTAVAAAPALPPPPAAAPTTPSAGLPAAEPTLPVQVPSPTVAMSPTKAPEPGEKSSNNEFVMPGKNSSGVTASLASARTRTANVSPTNEKQSDHELAIEGYCAVSVIEHGEWIEGKKEFGVIHLGKLYLFANKSAMDSFITDPMPYTPMLDEIDVVRFFEEKRIVRGRREWGVIDPIHNRMYFFADKEAMEHFENTFEAYLDAAMAVMDKAVSDANPGL